MKRLRVATTCWCNPIDVCRGGLSAHALHNGVCHSLSLCAGHRYAFFWSQTPFSIWFTINGFCRSACPPRCFENPTVSIPQPLPKLVRHAGLLCRLHCRCELTSQHCRAERSKHSSNDWCDGLKPGCSLCPTPQQPSISRQQVDKQVCASCPASSKTPRCSRLLGFHGKAAMVSKLQPGWRDKTCAWSSRAATRRPDVNERNPSRFGLAAQADRRSQRHTGIHCRPARAPLVHLWGLAIPRTMRPAGFAAMQRSRS